jgi:hypothetical protein
MLRVRMSFVLLCPVALATEEEVSWGCLGTGDAVGYMLVALLLAMLLLQMVHRRERVSAPPRVPRISPRSADELGKALFGIALRGDASAYRGLFLLGLEIQEALGREADAYIDARVPGMFEASLDKIASRIPAGASFDGTVLVGRDALALRLMTATGARPTVIVGTVTQVRGIFRMVHPGFVDSPGARPGARGPSSR